MAQNTILITGGTGKLGLLYINHFLDKGWKVIYTSTTKKKIKNLKKNKDLYGIKIDFNNENSLSDLSKELEDRKLLVNHLVNNARSLSSLKVDKDGLANRENFVKEFIMDVFVPYNLSMLLFKKQKKDLKTITNISSQYSLVAANPIIYDNHLIESPIQYGVSKSALNHLTRELAVRFSKSKIRVNCIAYGGLKGRVSKEFEKKYSKLNPMGRMLKNSDVAGPLDYLVSESSSFITGQVISVDGGWTIW